MAAPMSQINICRPHQRSVAEVRDAVERLAQSMSSQFQVACRWQGDTLRFSRSGVDGQIHVESDQVRVQASLGLLMSAFAPLVEREIIRHLDEQLA